MVSGRRKTDYADASAANALAAQATEYGEPAEDAAIAAAAEPLTESAENTDDEAETVAA